MKRRGFLQSLIAAVVLSPVLCRMGEKVETFQERDKPISFKTVITGYDKYGWADVAVVRLP